jgi:hypothetical protein
MPVHMQRARRGFSLMEVSLTLLVMTAISVLIIPTLLSGEQAGTAREAQASVELAVGAGVDLYDRAGTPSASLTLLAPLAPRLTLRTSASVSTTTDEVSVAITDGAFVAAATDTKGFCWGVAKQLTGGGADRYLVLETASCSAAAFAPHLGTDPPDGEGTAWSNPFEV